MPPKLLLSIVYKQDAKESYCLCQASDLTGFSFFTRSTVAEHLKFATRTVVQRTPPGSRTSVGLKDIQFLCHTYVRNDGLAGVVVAEKDYPVRVAFALVQKTLADYESKVGSKWKEVDKDLNQEPLFMAEELARYQNPVEADKFAKIQKNLDDVKEIMAKNIEDILARGETLDSLMEKSQGWSDVGAAYFLIGRHRCTRRRQAKCGATSSPAAEPAANNCRPPALASKGTARDISLDSDGGMGQWTDIFKDVSWVLSRRIEPPNRDSDAVYAQQILTSPRVQAAIDNVCSSAQIDMPRTLAVKEARRILAGMMATVHERDIRIGAWIARKMWRQMYENIRVNEDGVRAVRQLVESNVPVILLPMHKSHIDYILVSYVCLAHHLYPPHIVAGENLNMPVVGRLLKSGGAVFIRREFGREARDRIYKSVFHEYMAALLERRHMLECFIEGTRTRNGKVRNPKAGFIKVIADLVCEGGAKARVPDVMLVPIALSYDHVIEGADYVSEVMGASKQKESLTGLVNAMSRVLRVNFGSIDVHFCKPLSFSSVLRDFVAHHARPGHSHSIVPRMLPSLAPSLSPSTLNTLPILPSASPSVTAAVSAAVASHVAATSSAASDSSPAHAAELKSSSSTATSSSSSSSKPCEVNSPAQLLTLDKEFYSNVLDDAGRRRFHLTLANRVMFEMNRKVTVTATTVVATVLLTSKTRGMPVSTLIQRTQWLKTQLLERGATLAPVFMTATPAAIVDRALQVLRRSIRRTHDIVHSFQQHESLSLCWYRNSLVHFFVSEAMIAVALASIWKYRPTLTQTGPAAGSSVPIIPDDAHEAHAGIYTAGMSSSTVGTGTASSSSSTSSSSSLSTSASSSASHSINNIPLLSPAAAYAVPTQAQENADREGPSSSEALTVPAVLSVERKYLLKQVRLVSQMLKREFIFTPAPDIEENFDAAIDGLMRRGVLFASPDGQHVCIDPRGRDVFFFLCMLLWPFIELYWVGATALFALQSDTIVEEKKLCSFASERGEALFYSGGIDFFEAVNVDGLKTVFEWATEQNIIVAHEKGGTRFLQLRPQFHSGPGGADAKDGFGYGHTTYPSASLAMSRSDAKNAKRPRFGNLEELTRKINRFRMCQNELSKMLNLMPSFLDGASNSDVSTTRELMLAKL